LTLVLPDGTLYLTTYQSGIPRMENNTLNIKLSVSEMINGNLYGK